jgi:hypothetical protein
VVSELWAAVNVIKCGPYKMREEANVSAPEIRAVRCLVRICVEESAAVCGRSLP